MVVTVFYKNCSKEACAISVKGLHGESAAPSVSQVMMEQTGFGL